MAERKAKVGRESGALPAKPEPSPTVRVILVECESGGVLEAIKAVLNPRVFVDMDGEFVPEPDPEPPLKTADGALIREGMEVWLAVRDESGRTSIRVRRVKRVDQDDGLVVFQSGDPSLEESVFDFECFVSDLNLRHALGERRSKPRPAEQKGGGW